MDLWFNEDSQEDILIDYMPKGKVYKQLKIKGSNFNKLMIWLSSSFLWLVEMYNITFKGVYICKSTFLLDNFKKDYNIPNEVFYNTDIDEHRKDIFALRYLMKGNTEWHFRAVANMYGYDVDVISGKEYFRKYRIPNAIPQKLYSGIENVNNVLVIIFYSDEKATMPDKIPHKLGSGLKIAKIKKIFDIMKQSQVKIMYLKPKFSLKTESITDYMPISVPHKLGTQTITKVVYDEQTNQERIKLCIDTQGE